MATNLFGELLLQLDDFVFHSSVEFLKVVDGACLDLEPLELPLCQPSTHTALRLHNVPQGTLVYSAS